MSERDTPGQQPKDAPDVGLSQSVANKVVLAVEKLLKPIQRLKQGNLRSTRGCQQTCDKMS